MTLRKQIATGAVWLVCGRAVVRTIGLISTLILARLLGPEDFGLIALAMSIVAILDVMSAFSFDLALIADQKASCAHYNSAWSMSVLKGLASALFLLFVAEYVGFYFDDVRLVGICQALAFFLLIRGFENVGVVDFRKNLEFEKEFFYNFYLKVTGFFVTMAAAYALLDYRALVLGIVFQALARVFFSYVMSDFRPRWDLSRWRSILSFSKWLLLNNLLIFINQRSATFLLSKALGMRATGLFNVAEEIGNLVTTELVWPIQRAVLSRLRKDFKRTSAPSRWLH